MFRFANPEYFWGLLAIPLLMLFFVASRLARRRAIKRFGSENLMLYLMPNASKSRPVFKFIVLLLALAFFITGLARPQFGSKLKKVKREGVELVIALDVSNSMLAEDIKPNRLERAK
ncbi:MAG: BatA domain-containing protein, partial [Mariniphaga sp.]|nr:BatA domain-containing protein [Mariniphaga sp.]